MRALNYKKQKRISRMNDLLGVQSFYAFILFPFDGEFWLGREREKEAGEDGGRSVFIE